MTSKQKISDKIIELESIKMGDQPNGYYIDYEEMQMIKGSIEALKWVLGVEGITNWSNMENKY